MTPEQILQLRRDQEGAQIRADALLHELQNAVKDCDHDWGEVRYIPEEKDGYHIPADSHGSDFRGSCDVPARTIRRWKRCCKKCHFKQITERTIQVTVGVGRCFDGCSASEEVPAFGLDGMDGH